MKTEQTLKRKRMIPIKDTGFADLLKIKADLVSKTGKNITYDKLVSALSTVSRNHLDETAALLNETSLQHEQANSF